MKRHTALIGKQQSQIYFQKLNCGWMKLVAKCRCSIRKLQGCHCEVGSEGSWTANPRADVLKSRIRPRNRVSLPRKAKPTEGEFRVNAVVAGKRGLAYLWRSAFQAVG